MSQGGIPIVKTSGARPRAYCIATNNRAHACAYVRKSCWHLGTCFLFLFGWLRVSI